MKSDNSKTVIFSTGAHLQATKCIINGIKQWRWVAVGFEDDSFLNGKMINPIDYANKKSGLIGKI